MKYIDLLNQYKNQEGFEYEAVKFLITEISGFSKSDLYLNLQTEISQDLLVKLEFAISQYIVKKLPVQYIVGYTYFLGSKIYVKKGVLIPRFETEEVVLEATKLFPKIAKINICDIGTGSGVIAISLKKHYVNSNVLAIDIEDIPIEVAKYNSKTNNVEINIIKNDMLFKISETFDLIISNPPYIDINEEVMSLVYDNEPHTALFSPNCGLFHYEEILKSSKVNLRKNGYIVFEIAYNKRSEMIELVSKYYSNYKIMKDIYDNDRIMIIKGD